jgi:hypothetical protein
MKKILLILLCLPIIGFGQDDKLDEIIFLNGDTIYGNVIEIGIKEVIYKYKNENINIVARISGIEKIKFSSGRTHVYNSPDDEKGWDYKQTIFLGCIATVFLSLLIFVPRAGY